MNIFIRLAVVALFVFAIGAAEAQGPAIPYVRSTTQAKITIAVTNTFQAALAANLSRRGCTIQYVAVAGTKGFVFFGPATPSDTTTAFQLTNGQSVTCSIDGMGMVSDQVLVTGTATDIFIVSTQ